MANTIDFGCYSSDQVIATFKGVDVSNGIADGTWIKASRNEKSFKVKVGAGGRVTRIRTRNFTGIISLTIQAGSPTNDLLQNFVDLDEDITQAVGAGVGSFLIKDLNSNMLCTAEQAWVTKVPDMERSEDGPNTEWEFECAKLIIKHGGALA